MIQLFIKFLDNTKHANNLEEMTKQSIRYASTDVDDVTIVMSDIRTNYAIITKRSVMIKVDDNTEEKEDFINGVIIEYIHENYFNDVISEIYHARGH